MEEIFEKVVMVIMVFLVVSTLLWMLFGRFYIAVNPYWVMFFGAVVTAIVYLSVS